MYGVAYMCTTRNVLCVYIYGPIYGCVYECTCMCGWLVEYCFTSHRLIYGYACGVGTVGVCMQRVVYV